MKKMICGSFLFLICMLLASCTTGLKQSEIDPWLADISGANPPEINIEGRWHDADVDPNTAFGWGRGSFDQNNGKLEGRLGNYNVTGTVSGNKVYMVFLSGGRVYYTARLEMKEKGMLRGNYFDHDDRRQENGYPMNLKKSQE